MHLTPKLLKRLQTRQALSPKANVSLQVATLWPLITTTTNPRMCQFQKKRVQDFKNTSLVTPGPCPFTFDIVINWRNKDVPFGKLIRVSPIEMQDALLWRVAERILAGASADEVSKWKTTLMSVTCRFFANLDNDDSRYFHSLQLRELRQAEGAACKLSTIQVVCDVWTFKVLVLCSCLC